jgi:predicted ester cyclase
MSDIGAPVRCSAYETRNTTLQKSVDERFALCVCMGRSNAIPALFMRGDPAYPDLNCGIRLAAFTDFHAEIHWQLAEDDRVTTSKTYHGTHQGKLLGIPSTGRAIHFETVDVMRMQNGKITDHWGVGNLLSLMQQIGGWTPPESQAITR